MGLLTKEQIFGKKDILFEEVKIPEWAEGEADSVLVWGLRGTERDEFETACRIKKPGGSTEFNPIGVRAKLCALAIRDVDGNRIFDDTEVIQLGAKSAKALERIFDVAQKLSGMTKEVVDELAKNS